MMGWPRSPLALVIVAFCCCCVSSWVPTAAASRSAADQHAAYVVPLQMRQGALRTRSSSTTSSSSSRNLLGAGKVNVLGSVREGYFYATLPFGSPAQQFSLIVDTGSTITYVPCNDCKHCGNNHYNDAYNPSRSRTSRPVHCTDKACKTQPSMMFCSDNDDSSGGSGGKHHSSSSDITRAVQKALEKKYGGGSSESDSRSGGVGSRSGGGSSSSSGGQCMYEIFYAEQSTSKGKILQDIFTFPDNVTSVPVTLGCESGETGEIYRQKADGILGMGNSAATFHAELAASGAIPHMFSLCFGFPSGGALLLGDPPLTALPPAPSDSNPAKPQPQQPQQHQKSHQPPAFSWVPLVPTTSDFYRVKLTAIKLGPGGHLPVSPAVYDEGHGTILDSGTTYLCVPTPVRMLWVARVRAAAKAKGLHEFTDKYKDLCFSGGGLKPDFENLHDYFPEASLEFEGGGVLRLPPYRYMFQYGHHGSYCLAVMDSQWGGILIGGVATRNVLVKYDLESKRVGFADVDCHALGHMPAQQFNLPLAQSNMSTAAAVHKSAAKAAAAAAAASSPPAAAAGPAADTEGGVEGVVKETAADAAAAAMGSLFGKIAAKVHKATRAADAAVAAAQEVLAEDEQQQQQQQKKKGGADDHAAAAAVVAKVVSSQLPVALPQQLRGEAAAAAAAAEKGGLVVGKNPPGVAHTNKNTNTNTTTSSSSSSGTESKAATDDDKAAVGNSTTAAAPAASAPPPPAAPLPPVHWGGGSGVLNPNPDDDGSWVEKTLVALTGLAFLGIVGGIVWRFWGEIHLVVGRYLPPLRGLKPGGSGATRVWERAGFSQVSTTDDSESSSSSRVYPGADIMGVALLPGFSRWAGGSSSSGGGSRGGAAGKYAGGQIALTATALSAATAATAAAAAANGAAAAARGQQAASSSFANGGSSSNNNNSRSGGGSGVVGFSQLVVADDAIAPEGGLDLAAEQGLAGLSGVPQGLDAVKSPPGFRDQGLGLVPGGVSNMGQPLVRLPPPLQQQQQQRFVAEFSIDDDAGGCGGGGISSSSSIGQQQQSDTAPQGSSDQQQQQLTGFQSISLDDWQDAQPPPTMQEHPGGSSSGRLL